MAKVQTFSVTAKKKVENLAVWRFFRNFAVIYRQGMKKGIFIIVLLVATGWLLAGCGQEKEDCEEVQVTDTVPLLVMQVQKCARLYTTEYHIHKIVTHEDVVRLKGKLMRQDFNIALPLGERKIAIPMDAKLKAYIDFSNFSEQNVEREGTKITIVLPDPQVTLTSSKINQKDIKEYVGLVRSHFTDKEMTLYEQQGRQSIINNIKMTDIVERSRQSAARILIPMLQQLGYQEGDITIAFRRDMNLNTLINTSIEQP